MAFVILFKIFSTHCVYAIQVSKSNVIGVPGFVAKPGGGGRPVPARHVSQLPRRLLWLPGALLSSVIDAFRKVFVPFRFRFFCPLQPLLPEPK